VCEQEQNVRQLNDGGACEQADSVSDLFLGAEIHLDPHWLLVIAAPDRRRIVHKQGFMGFKKTGT